MKRVLFVDDEPRILDGLRRMLHPLRAKWDMVFALGGEAALAELAAAPFDVVVTDMRMPGVDGAAVLRHARAVRPETVRIVLSGYSEMDATLRALLVAHQFLAKPCDPALLLEAVERACSLRELLADEALRRTVGAMASLPSIPRRYAALSAALDRLDAPIREVASVVEKDVAMAAKVLQLVNSSFFGLPHRVANIENAVSYLGTNTLRNLLLSVEVFETLSGSGVERVRFSESLARHSRLAAGIARGLLPDRRQAEDAFTAALLHDIGSLVLLSHLPEAYSRISREASMTGCPLLDAELHVLGTTHAEIGAYLLGIWGLPCPIVEAVAHHHAPGRVEHERFDGLSAVYVANALAHHVADVGAAPAAEPVAGLDLAYLRRLGVDGQLGAWREMAIAVARAEPEGT